MRYQFVSGRDAKGFAGVGAGEVAGLGGGEKGLYMCEGVGGEVVDGLVGVVKGVAGDRGCLEHAVDGFGEEGFEGFFLGGGVLVSIYAAMNVDNIDNCGEIVKAIRVYKG